MDTKLLKTFEQSQLKTDIPEMAPGDTVTVTYKIKEKGKERLQSYTGIIIARNGRGITQSITVRKVTAGIGVEKVFPIHAPFIDSIKGGKHGGVRRAKLYYMRKRVGKNAIKIRARKKAPTKEKQESKKSVKKPAKTTKAKAE